MITCPICSVGFKQLTAQHLKKHKYSVVQFKFEYPKVFLGNKNTEISLKKLKKERIINDDIHCLQCNKLIETLQRKKQKFCSHHCSAIHNNLKRGYKNLKNTNCKNCNKNLFGGEYCNHKCQQEHLYKRYIDNWKNGLETGIVSTFNTSKYIRRYLFEKYENKCCECGWAKINPITKKIPLQVEHVDGNWKNNKEENLKLLCPNCHSLTPTYGALNKGNGRKERYALVA